MTWTPDMPDRRSCSDMVTWKSYVDAVFAEHRVQVSAALEAHDSRLAMNHEAMDARLVAFQQQLDRRIAAERHATDIAEREHSKATAALREAQNRAVDQAATEREKAAAALRYEQHRAADTAEREREKSAQALSQTLAQSISEGDARLREHITNQVEQIGGAISGVEGRAQLRHDALRTQMDDRFQYTETAVAKAETATEKRFSSVNEFRAQLSDQVATFLPREVADAQLSELRKSLSSIHARLDTMQGHATGETATREQQQISIGQMVGVIGLVIALIAIGVGAFT